MKTTKISLSLAIIMFVGALAFTSCKKKEKTPAAEPDNESSSASDNALSENTSNDVIAIGSQVSENSGTLTTYRSSDPTENPSNGGIDLIVGSCASITPIMTGTAVTGYTVDFGAVGNTNVCADGRVRSGKLVYDFTGSPLNSHYRTPGFKFSVTSQAYVVDGNAVSIAKTVTNTSPLAISGQTAYSGTNLTWNITSNITITKANNGGTITWTCNRTKELTNSNDPTCYKGQIQAIDWTKAIIKLNGAASGTNNKGEQYTATATNLVRNFTCHPDLAHPKRCPFIGGTIDYTPGTRATRHIDYGNGIDCDQNAIVTINGQSWPITLP